MVFESLKKTNIHPPPVKYLKTQNNKQNKNAG